MPRSVFYSWQADLPRRVTRDFIRAALKEAIKELNGARHSEERIVLKQDTTGASGSPEITSLVLTRIAQADVHVLDMSFIVQTEDENGVKKGIPNPNVMLERGWGMAKIGIEKVLGVMNTHFGAPGELMPFNVRHARNPIQFNLAPEASLDEIAEERRKLVRTLTSAIRVALGAPSSGMGLNIRLQDGRPVPIARLGDPTCYVEDMMEKLIEDFPLSKTPQPAPPPSAMEEPRAALEGLSPGELPEFVNQNKQAQAAMADISNKLYPKTASQVKQHNARREVMYDDMRRYYTDSFAIFKRICRSVEPVFILTNDGASPATEIDIVLGFPAGTIAVEHEAAYASPDVPESYQSLLDAKYDPYGLAGLDRSRRRLDRVLAQSVQDRFTNVALEIDDRSSTAHFRVNRLKHGGRPEVLSGLVLILPEDFGEDAVCISVSVHSAEMTAARRVEILLPVRAAEFEDVLARLTPDAD